MKPILYAGAALMIGASIYGFVDYENTKHKKEFNNMYSNEKNNTTVQKEAVVTNAVTTEKKLAETKTDIKKEENKTDQPVVSTEEKKTVKKVVKKRKFRFNEFSRAPIREEVIEEPVPAKKESKTNENKEQ